MNSVLDYFKDLNIYSILIFLAVNSIFIGIFYYQKYINDCFPTISNNIEKNIEKALNDFPSVSELFKNINFDTYIDNYINDKTEEYLNKYSEEFEKYGVNKKDLLKLSEDKELRGKIMDYIKQNGYQQVLNDPKKQTEVKKIFTEYIYTGSGKKEKLKELTNNINRQKTPIPINLGENFPSRINDVIPGTQDVNIESQVQDFKEFSKIPNRLQDNLYTGVIPLTYLKG